MLTSAQKTLAQESFATIAPIADDAAALTNAVNLRPPSGNPPGAGVPMNAPAFLIRTSARDARQLQWGLRFLF
jgi:hypothetical protein